MGIMYLYSMQEGRALRLGSESVMRDALPRIIGGLLMGVALNGLRLKRVVMLHLLNLRPILLRGNLIVLPRIVRLSGRVFSGIAHHI